AAGAGPTAGERRARRRLAARVAAGGRDQVRWIPEPLGRVAALLGRCAAAVTHDSGLMHLAAARRTRVVAIFGSTSPVLGFAPVGEGHPGLCRRPPRPPWPGPGPAPRPRRPFRSMATVP